MGLGLKSYLEGAHEGLVHAHHAPRVVKLPAVVRSREERHQLPLGKELVAVLHDLRARNTQESTLRTTGPETHRGQP